MARKREKTMVTEPIAESQVRRIVSSEHLVSDKCPELSELEFGLIIASHAFGRWMTRCMAGAGVKDMTETEILVVHHVNHRGRTRGIRPPLPSIRSPPATHSAPPTLRR